MRTGIRLAEQERALAYGERVFTGERLPPAMLLVGPYAAGKASLAFEFAKRHLCQYPEKGERPCGACFACREMAFLRYPDCILFSARDIAPACRALRAVVRRARLEPLAAEFDLLVRRVVQRIRSGFFKLKEAAQKELDTLEERILALESLVSRERREFSQSEEESFREELAGALDDLAELDAMVQHSVLPIAGIQEIIRTLSRRPIAGQHRAVFIEGIETFRTEGANAFLKTLEEPPPGTLILLTASDLEGVPATIRSRSAILSLARMSEEEIRGIAHEYYGLEDEPPEYLGASCRDIYAYLESLGDEAGAVQKDIIRFLDLIQNADREPSIFDFARGIEKSKSAYAFCSALIDLITENVVAKETAIGRERLYASALSHYSAEFLRRMLHEVRALSLGMATNNFSASQGIVGILQAFWLEQAS